MSQQIEVNKQSCHKEGPIEAEPLLSIATHAMGEPPTSRHKEGPIEVEGPIEAEP
jgi:hypothetical protein